MTEPQGSPVQGAQMQSGQSAADPSMEDILASIRRILSEDEVPAPAEPAPPSSLTSAGPDNDDVLVLDASMMAADDQQSQAAAAPQESARLSSADRSASDHLPMPSAAHQPPMPSAADHPPAPSAAHHASTLLAPEAAAAAASAMETLVRTLGDRPDSDPQTLVRSGGPTIEDIVRDEIRPLLKAWLDANLPRLTERLVREEIQRLSGRIPR